MTSKSSVKDYVFYRDKILKETRAGDTVAAASARESFNQVNRWLDEYDRVVEAAMSQWGK